MKTARIGWVVFVGLVLVAFIWTLAPATAKAAEKDFIRMIVPHAPGSGVDVQARTISDGLAKALGKPVVVENLPGAGGIIGLQEIARAPKDGSTIGMASSNMVILPSMHKTLPYDTVKDFTPVSIVGTVSVVLVTNPASPFRNLKELIALAKSQPGKLTFGSAGIGSVLHLAGELFCSEAGVQITHVPYKGGGQLMTDVMGGHVDMGFLALPSCVEQVKAGKLRAIGVSTPKRASGLPDAPTLAESGLPNYSYDAWVALIGPGNLPQPIIKRLNTAVLETLKVKEIRQALLVHSEIVGSTPEEAKRILEADLIKNANLVKQAGVKVD